VSRGARDVPDLASSAEARIRLNRSERLYLALEGVASAIGQVHVLRFGEPHSEAELRAGVRYLIRICPRLRTLVEPGFLGHRLAVLPEGERVERLFAGVFRVVPGGDEPAAVQALLNQLVNEPFDLEGALPLRARLLTAGPRPVLVLSLHHVVCDGRGMIHLLDALMAHLNGEDRAAMPLENPSMLPAVLPPTSPPAPFAEWPRSLWRSLVRRLRERARWTGRPALTLVKERGAFGPTGVRLHDVAVALASIKKAAKARACTVTELVVAALAASFAAQAEPRTSAVATVRLSHDLRPYFPAGRRPTFGNYVASFLVRATRWDDLEATVSEVRAQMREALQGFEHREMSLPLLLAELTPRLIGRRLLGWYVRALKRRGRLEQVTLHYSNLGDVDLLNGHGDRAQADALAFFTPALGPYVGCVGLGGRLYLGVTYPRSEVDEAIIERLLADFDGKLAALTG
jgi:hypothetical protein